jgi:transposase
LYEDSIGGRESLFIRVVGWRRQRTVQRGSTDGREQARERLERAQRDLSWKEHGSNNLEIQRKVVAGRHAELKRKRRDFLHRLSNYYAREYAFAAAEDLGA